jgi:hypothetical protein
MPSCDVAYFEDLTPYSYHGPGEDALSVGWLGSGHPFPAGDADGAVIAAVLRLVRDHPVNRMRGWHDCDLCERPAGQPGSPRPPKVQMEVDGSLVLLGNCEIRVRTRAGQAYAAPSLLAHYMAVHRYLPPPDFLEALRLAAS